MLFDTDGDFRDNNGAKDRVDDTTGRARSLRVGGNTACHERLDGRDDRRSRCTSGERTSGTKGGGHAHLNGGRAGAMAAVSLYIEVIQVSLVQKNPRSRAVNGWVTHFSPVPFTRATAPRTVTRIERRMLAVLDQATERRLFLSTEVERVVVSKKRVEAQDLELANLEPGCLWVERRQQVKIFGVL